ncbi:hypothetical protein SPRG_07262 [Saprolegnia parasitica CBS 223.65]|uniref:DUF2723 domain-containing protein n=1 Tax=Saprolegnia parasitica (strain CBS 223.65) TaxID=695850 RepID=A0A067CB27_SAPPC|nr:hypothetical protein SPRG_07262 [Saprolegnia parasitica CBS 223.65]KDO27984.1 hypothetical protein SPRG_07262 [Saprolegnia parasitica CBS 223.65]|eukprot:XP_012201433.1 hypothetical protein SPRG_07262 [Saprolegnia parasitica CBS 223.65]
MQRRKSKRSAPAVPLEEATCEGPITWADPVLAALLATTLGVYGATLYPSVAGGDSGELLAEACHLGVAHPPGYPLYSMLNYVVMQLLPGGPSKAWRANAFSAACDSLCAIYIYWATLLWLPPSYDRWMVRCAGATAAVSFALSPLVWTYAVGAEVFSLNNAFAGALLYVLLRFATASTPWPLACVGATLCGLALTNQHTIVLFELPLIPWVLWSLRATLSLRRLGLLSLFFVLGLLPYVYLPVTSFLKPQPGSWGDVTSIGGFVHHLRRGDYGTFRLFSTEKETEGLYERLALYFSDLVQREGSYVVAPLAVVGCVVSLRHAAGPVVLAMYLVYIVGFHALANLPLTEGLLYGVHMRFWQQPNVIVFTYAGVGLGVILQALPTRPTWRLAIGATCAVGAGVGQYVRWHAICDQSSATFIAQYAKALLDPLPKNALVFINYDLQWTSMRYLTRCEGYRPDLTIINLSMMTYAWFGTKHALYPQLIFPGSHLVPASTSQGGGFSLLQLLDANAKRYRKAGIYLGGQLNYKDSDLLRAYTFVPHGLLDKLHPTSMPVYRRLKTWHAQMTKTLQVVHHHLPTLPPPSRYSDETWEWTIARDYHMKRLSLATFLLDETIKANGSIAWLAEAAKPMEHSLLSEPRQFWTDDLLKNLGLAYAYMVKSPETLPSEATDVLLPHVGASVRDAANWKDRASARMLEVWHMWLQLPSAKRDPGYAAIQGIVAQFLPS